MEVKIEGIKCDHCTWSDMRVKFEDYKNWVNRECPECGSNLLTEKNFSECLALKDLEPVLKFMTGEIEEVEVENEHFKFSNGVFQRLSDEFGKHVLKILKEEDW